MNAARVVLQVGSTFASDFLVESALGVGGMGAVHRVHQKSTDKAPR